MEKNPAKHRQPALSHSSLHQPENWHDEIHCRDRAEVRSFQDVNWVSSNRKGSLRPTSRLVARRPPMATRARGARRDRILPADPHLAPLTARPPLPRPARLFSPRQPPTRPSRRILPRHAALSGCASKCRPPFIVIEWLPEAESLETSKKKRRRPT